MKYILAALLLVSVSASAQLTPTDSTEIAQGAYANQIPVFKMSYLQGRLSAGGGSSASAAGAANAIQISNGSGIFQAALNAYINGGFLGLGTSSPSKKLQITGSSANFMQGIQLDNTNDAWGESIGMGTEVDFTHFNPGFVASSLATATGGESPRSIRLANSGPGGIVMMATNGNFRVSTGGGSAGADTSFIRFIVSDVGNVGIGTTRPSAKLHTTGSLRFQGVNEGMGKVLTSDATGNASWQSTTSATQTFVNNGTYNITPGPGTITADINPSSSLATLKFLLPTTTYDGQNVTFTFGGLIAVGATVTTGLTIETTGGQNIYGTVGATAVGGDTITYKYVVSSNTWKRIL